MPQNTDCQPITKMIIFKIFLKVLEGKTASVRNSSFIRMRQPENAPQPSLLGTITYTYLYIVLLFILHINKN